MAYHALLLAFASVVALALFIVGPAPSGYAEEEKKTPWQGIVVAENAAVHAKPASDSPQSQNLPKDAKLAVIERVEGDGAIWYRTNVGFVRADAVEVRREPWIAEIVKDNVTVYAKPNAQSPVRLSVEKGQLMRVIGVSPGMEGDTNTWWRTTEGYVHLDTLREAQGQYATTWAMPAKEEALNGWWAEVTSTANVRAAPTTQSPKVGRLSSGQHVKVLGEEQGENVLGSDKWYRIDGGRYAGARIHSSLVKRLPPLQPNTKRPDGVSENGTWIVVDRATNTLTLVKNGKPELVTLVALGEAGTETPAGQYATFGKFRYDDMNSETLEEEIDDYYDLPNVPGTQYYKKGGFAIHGTYWHDNFGTRQSLGCVNLTVTDGHYLFEQTKPNVPEGQNHIWTEIDAATPVLIVD